MSRKPSNSKPEPTEPGREPVRAVILIEQASARREIARSLTQAGVECSQALDQTQAMKLVREARIDVVVMDGPTAKAGSTSRSKFAFPAAHKISTATHGTGVVLMLDNPSLEDAVGAMQSGVADVIPAATTPAELATRVLAAAGRSSTSRQRWDERERRAERLRKLCKGLSVARHELTRQISSLCTNLTGAYQELADQISLVSLASEFNSAIRQELDLESLLRVGVEAMLTRTGPTNVAVFLPSANGDFSLGAYVNYDRTKEGAESLMDHLCAAVAPRFESLDGLVHLPTPEAVRDELGDAADWIDDCSVIAFACWQEGECLAVFLLFRAATTPFREPLLPPLRLMAELFGRQLARVIHIHHRHLPKNKWGQPGDPYGGADDIDLAA